MSGPTPTNNPENTLEIKNENTLEIKNENNILTLSNIIIILTLIIHAYLIYQTEDIIYRVLLAICFISIIWLLNKKNKNRIIDDDGINLIEG